jgi:hypothetical protein
MIYAELPFPQDAVQGVGATSAYDAVMHICCGGKAGNYKNVR